MIFKRQDSHKKPKLRSTWRKPKGLQSKMRLHLRGYSRSPSKGFGRAAADRGKTKDGLMPIKIDNLAQLKGLEAKTQGIIISSSTGERKRLDIIREALKMKIKIINIRDAEGYVKKADELLAQKKKAKEEADKSKKKKLEDRKKKAEEKAKEDKVDEKDEGEKKKEQKKELDKVLTTSKE